MPEFNDDGGESSPSQSVTDNKTYPLVRGKKSPPAYNGTEGRTSRSASAMLPGVTYSWSNLNVFAEEKNFFGKIISKTQILKEVSGLCKGGQLLAIMGASGAGKTTLLNVLTYRSLDLKVQGDVRINGHKAEPNTLMGISAYVQQVDLFTRVFTVREQLNFHAHLRIGKRVKEAERKRRIEEVLTDLGMQKCADTLIGEPGRIKGISGGEKKRLAFACELITNPLLLLCDEPTSGLDSFMAQSVMKAMKQMTLQGRTVISTIHQPSSEVFAMFDRLLILAEGRLAFLGTVPEAHAFFERLNKPCPDNFNPGDHFIHTMAIKVGREEECKNDIHSICDDFSEHEGVKLARMLEEAKLPPEEDALNHITLSKSPYRATYSEQFSAVLKRAALELGREPSVSAVKVFQALFFSLIFGLIYLNQDLTQRSGVTNITAVLFLFVINTSMSVMFPVITVFAGEMPLFLREHWNGLFRSDVYFITRNLVEFPIYIIIPVAFCSVSYYMIGFREEAHYFFINMGILILVANTAVSYGYMISCMADDYDTAIVLSTPLLFPLMLFGGFFVQADSIPVYLSWMQYLSWFRYGFEAACINQWSNFSTPFPNDTLPVGNYVLSELSFEQSHMKIDLWATAILMVVYRVMAYGFLVLKTIRKKQ